MSVQPENDDASDLRESQEEEELLKLEEEVEKMAETILEYRTTLPDQLTSTLSSLLAAQRPVLPAHLPEPDSITLHEAGLEDMPLAVTEVPEEAEKIQLLKQKIASNASALPMVLNRMKEYVAKIDKLESSNVNIDPAFKRKRIT